MAADLVEDSTEGAAASTAVDSGVITVAGVPRAGMGGGAVMAGTEAGVGTAGDIQAGESALVLVPIGRRYPYAYGYPYYSYYPYYPYYPYSGPNAYAPAHADQYNGGNRDARDNSQRQDSNYPGPQRSASA